MQDQYIYDTLYLRIHFIFQIVFKKIMNRDHKSLFSTFKFTLECIHIVSILVTLKCNFKMYFYPHYGQSCDNGSEFQPFTSDIPLHTS